jgi:hypothetical protein
MSMNHHLLAKTTTDSILAKFKLDEWKCCGNVGTGFYRVGCNATFPSPDAAFYEDDRNLLVSFEFKPATETKRGILTGLGQSIAYLNSSNLSYLIIPQKLEDFEIGEYMTDLYSNQISGNLPVGLILYENNNPTNVTLVHNIGILDNPKTFTPIAKNRFWAKHQDLPVPLFHLILHCYYLKRIGQIKGDAFAYCWNTFLLPPSVLETMTPVDILDVNGEPIRTVADRKNMRYFEKKINPARSLTGSQRAVAISKLKEDASSDFVGDNNFNSVKKNLTTFIKHIGAIDSTSNITEDGIKLYHLGIVNGPNSKLFKDYFTRTILLTGHHLDLIFDLDNLCNQFRGEKTMQQIKETLLDDYETKGMIKRNPNRIAGDKSTVEFLKYEFILWNSLGLLVSTNGQPEKSFNWKKITEISSLPDL